jgi:hypothetical protein
MRLSCTKTSILRFFLFIFLTLLLNPNANAQAVSFVNVFAYNTVHNRSSMNESENEPGYADPIIDKHDIKLAGIQELPSLNFYHATESLSLKPPAYHTNKNLGKAYSPRCIIPARVCSFELNHSARLTFKLFKLVIVPLWQSK